MSLRDNFKKGTRWIIGNVNLVSFWTDNWAFQKHLASFLDPLISHDNSLVQDYISDFRVWDAAKLASVFPVNIVEVILAISISVYPRSDRMVWRLSVDGDFSTKSADWLAQGLLNYSPEISKFKWIWNLDMHLA